MELKDQGTVLWEKAQTFHLDDKFDEAEKIYTALLEQNHDNPGLMATLGTLYLQTSRIGLSIHFLEGALKRLGSKIPEGYANLGIAYLKAGRRAKAREAFEESIKQEPTAGALVNYSGMFVEGGEDDKCIELCERALKMEPDQPIAHWNMSIALLANGRWDKAWDEYEWGLKATAVRENRVILDVPLWDGTKGKTVLVYGEQGLGDEIMFTSMLPDLLKTNKVVFECHKRLETLFKKSFPGVPIHGTREDTEVSWAHENHFDYRLPIGGLGKFYRRSRESFPGTPYLKADPLLKGDKFRVGISWQGGGAKMGRVMKRSVPLSWWKSILDMPNVEFVSLQYTDSKEDLDLMDALGYSIKRMDEYVKAEDYYETARLVASCDLVISICTTVVHLAGALGVPCWVMTPRFPAWRYQNTGGMPWYRSVRLYRSPDVDQGAWRPVIDRIAFDLDSLMTGKNQLRIVA